MSSLCIYPQEESTSFLKPIADKLQEIGFDVYDGGTGDVEYVKTILDSIPGYDNIVFLGHGSSEALSGSGLTPLINGDRVDLLRGKRVFLLSCNSKEFISTYSLTDAIGFDIIPTGETDLYTILDQDYSYFENVPDDNDLEWFRSAIVRIIVNSFSDIDMDNMIMLYNRVKMYTNLERYACIRECKDLNYRDILRMLYDFKDCMVYVAMH